MAFGKRKLGLPIAAGLLAAITIIVFVFASGVPLPSMENNPSVGDNQGSLTVLLMDAPVEVDELWINVTGVEVHKVMEEAEVEEEGEEENDADSWVSIDLSGAEPHEIVFDLLKYRIDNEGENSLLLNLASGYTAEGDYNKIRITVYNATAKYYERDAEGNVVYEDGPEEGTVVPVIAKNQTLKVPSKKIDVITKFSIDAQNPVTVLIDMQPDWIAISKSGNLRPVLKATVSQSLEGVEVETVDSTQGEQTQ